MGIPNYVVMANTVFIKPPGLNDWEHYKTYKDFPTADKAAKKLSKVNTVLLIEHGWIVQIREDL